MCMETKAGFIMYVSMIDSVLEQMPGSVILQPILQTSTEKACESRWFAAI